MFSPPNEDDETIKVHLCRACYIPVLEIIYGIKALILTDYKDALFHTQKVLHSELKPRKIKKR